MLAIQVVKRVYKHALKIVVPDIICAGHVRIDAKIVNPAKVAKQPANPRVKRERKRIDRRGFRRR